MYSGSIRSFPSDVVISSILEKELPKDLEGENRKKVVKVASEHFANQSATKNNIRIESGLLITAMTEGCSLEDYGIKTPSEKITLNEQATGKLGGDLLSALLNASI